MYVRLFVCLPECISQKPFVRITWIFTQDGSNPWPRPPGIWRYNTISGILIFGPGVKTLFCFTQISNYPHTDISWKDNTQTHARTHACTHTRYLCIWGVSQVINVYTQGKQFNYVVLMLVQYLYDLLLYSLVCYFHVPCHIFVHNKNGFMILTSPSKG